MKTHEEIKKGLELCAADDCYEEKHTGCPYDDDELCIRHICGDALAYITQLEARVPKWISVEDRLPEDDENVMILSNERITFVGFYKNGQWISYSLYAIYGNVVTHWMPLPSTEGLK